MHIWMDDVLSNEVKGVFDWDVGWDVIPVPYSNLTLIRFSMSKMSCSAIFSHLSGGKKDQNLIRSSAPHKSAVLLRKRKISCVHQLLITQKEPGKANGEKSRMG